MNDLLDVYEICKNPKKYGFEKVDYNYKGNSIIVESLDDITRFSNYLYNLTDRDSVYLEEGITLQIPTKHRLPDSVELKR